MQHTKAIMKSAVFRTLLCFIVVGIFGIDANLSPPPNTSVSMHSHDPNKLLIKSTAETTTIKHDDGRESSIQSITSKITSWMKEKRKHNSKLNSRRGTVIEVDKQHDEVALPFVTLAYAQTLDGMIAASVPNEVRGDSSTTTSNLKLSSDESMILTHRLRSMHDAILVGGKTFLLDMPRLNARVSSSSNIEQPMPVVLDTNLSNMQLLLFGKIVSKLLSSQPTEDNEEATLPDITIDKINAHNPIICCSTSASKIFIDILEVFQLQQLESKERRKRGGSKDYKITVYKKVDDEFDHELDPYLPIRITICVTSYDRKHRENGIMEEEVTLTLLPCPTNDDKSKSNEASKTEIAPAAGEQISAVSLDIEQVLHQLYNQFGIESVMVEGGASILSSFLTLNDCAKSEAQDGTQSNDEEDNDDNIEDDDIGCIEEGLNRLNQSKNKLESKNKLVDCICATIAPKLIGGMGLPAFRGLGVRREQFNGDDMERPHANMLLPAVMEIEDGRFVALGSDCIFLGRV